MGATRRRARLLVAGIAAAAVSATAAPALGATSAEGITVSPNGSFTVVARGNGHGHGMSQYGARGAALAGLSTAAILRFYYPGARLVTKPPSRIRVHLSGVGTYPTVAPAADLVVDGVAGRLPTAGVRRYRLTPGWMRRLWLEKLGTRRGAKWTLVLRGLPNGAAFRRTGGGPVRVLRADGTSWSYFGAVAGFRDVPSGRTGGVSAVNRVSMTNYVAGVVPSEMPTSWPAAAVDAQAVAARTYGANAKLAPLARDYDICDSTWCQVYGGHAHYDSAGRLTWTDYPPAAHATVNRVLQYGGTPIFAQFSASNGGWSVAGGEPYLVAKRDPYDSAASGDPYIGYRRTVQTGSVAGYFRLRSVTQIVVTRRDGNGTWNGRVLSGYVVGTDRSGKRTQVGATGSDFAAAFGIGTTWFTMRTS